MSNWDKMTKLERLEEALRDLDIDPDAVRHALSVAATSFKADIDNLTKIAAGDEQGDNAILGKKAAENLAPEFKRYRARTLRAHAIMGGMAPENVSEDIDEEIT